MELTGKLYGDDAYGKIYNRETTKTYEILPATFEKYKKLSGMKKADAIIELAQNVLVEGTVSNNNYFFELDTNAFPTKEKIREIYLKYKGDEYMLWRDFGNSYIQALKKFSIDSEEIKEWKKESF